MLNNFKADLEEGKEAERIAFQVLTDFASSWILEDVSDIKDCRYLGDIKATHKETGKV